MASRSPLRFKIEGMSCPSCKEHLEEALSGLPGVQTVEVDFERGEARISGTVAPERVVQTVSEAGYRAIPLAGGPSHRPEGAPRKGGAPKRVAIIGTGGAAMACALRLAEEGVEVVLIERGTVGGTCVNIGCIPSKFLLRAAEMAHLQQAHPFAGIGRCRPKIDRRALLAQQLGIVERLRKEKYLRLIEENPHLTLIRGEARFLDPNRLEVSGHGTLRADAFLIATGASPAIPDIPGLNGTPFWTSTEALAAEEIPKRLLVLGASYIAAELAQAFRRLGAEVTLLVRSRILRREDPDLGETLEEAFREEGIEVKKGVQVEEVQFRRGLFGRRFSLRLSDGSRLSGDALLVATGRRPNTRGLGLEEIGVERDREGHIRVDPFLRTSRPHIYAAGDCASLPQFVYVAALAGKRAAENMLGLERPLELEPLPWVVFTEPQLAGVGLGEEEARRRGLQIEVRKFPVDQIPRGVVELRKHGWIKLIAERESGRLLGARIAAPYGGELVQIATVALKAGFGIDDLAELLFPYLTMAEGIKLCAQAFRKEVAKLSCCAG